MEKSMTPIQNTLPMDRAAAYQALVAQRKEHRFADGLLNPSEIAGGKFDSDELGPWSRWQGALDAEVVIVGHDHEAIDQHATDPPDAPLPPVASLGVITIVAVLTVNDCRNAGEAGS